MGAQNLPGTPDIGGTVVPSVVLGESSNATPSGQTADKTFTQQELDRVVTERLARQKAQFADYDDLRSKASKWQRLEDEQKSAADKMAEKLAVLQRERDEAIQQANDRLLRAAFIAEAALANVAHPEDVFALADVAGVTIDAQGVVHGAAEAVKVVVDAGRVPLVVSPQNRPSAPRLDGGAGGGNRSGERPAALSEEELAMARAVHIAPERYLARREELRKAREQR